MSLPTPVDPTVPTSLIASAARPTPRVESTNPTGVQSTQAYPTRNNPTPNESTQPKTDPTARPDSDRDWVVDAGLGVGGLAAAVASFSTLMELGYLVGWGRLAFLLPVTLDSFVITSTRVWLSRRTQSKKVRHFAAGSALGAIVLSLAGNAAFHAINAGAWHLGTHLWLLIVVVSSIPPVGIGMISHLAVLRSRDAEFAAVEADRVKSTQSSRPHQQSTVAGRVEIDPAPEPRPVPVVDSTPIAPTVDPTQAQLDSGRSTRPAAPAPTVTTRVESTNSTGGEGETDPLLDRAKKLAEAHRESTGRPIGADRLREELGVGSARARSLRDAVRGLHSVDQKEAV